VAWFMSSLKVTDISVSCGTFNSFWEGFVETIWGCAIATAVNK